MKSPELSRLVLEGTESSRDLQLLCAAHPQPDLLSAVSVPSLVTSRLLWHHCPEAECRKAALLISAVGYGTHTSQEGDRLQVTLSILGDSPRRHLV